MTSPLSTTASSPLLLQAIDKALQYSKDGGDQIRALAQDMKADADSLQKNLDLMATVESWKTQAWTDGENRTAAMGLMGWNVAPFYDTIYVTVQKDGAYEDLKFSFPPIQTSVAAVDIMNDQAKIDALAEGYYYSTKNNKTFAIFKNAAGVKKLDNDVTPGAAWIENATTSTIESLLKVGQSVAESKTQTAQAKQVYMQELISDQSKWNLFATNVQQRHENLLMQLIAAW